MEHKIEINKKQNEDKNNQHFVKLFSEMFHFGKSLNTDSLNSMMVPTVSRQEFVSSVMNKEKLNIYKLNILSNAKKIKESTRLNRKLKHFFEQEEKGIQIMNDLKTHPWSDESTSWKDEGFQQFCGIRFIEVKLESQSMNDILNVDGLDIQDMIPVQVHSNTMYDIDALYKIYRLIDDSMSMVKEMFERAILTRCSHVLELLYTQTIVGSMDTDIVSKFLGIFLYRVLTFMIQKGRIVHTYHYEWNYLNLFCHCIRHNCVIYQQNPSQVEITNSVCSETQSMVLPTNVFIKLSISLANISECFINNQDILRIPKEIANCLSLSYTEVVLSEVCQQEIIRFVSESTNERHVKKQKSENHC